VGDDAIVLQANLLAAAQSIEKYIAWLEALETNFSTDDFRDFRIGEALYEKKFSFDIVLNYSAYELYQKAIAEKDDLHQTMLLITQRLWPKISSGCEDTERSIAGHKTDDRSSVGYAY
jgi:hypothetical protein